MGEVIRTGVVGFSVFNRLKRKDEWISRKDAREMSVPMLVIYWKGKDVGDPKKYTLEREAKKIRDGWPPEEFEKRRRAAVKKCKKLGKILWDIRRRLEYESRAKLIK
jgi:hypothetical protein